MLNGGSLDAAAAANLGIVDILAEDNLFDIEVAAVAARIAEGPTRAFGLFKDLLDADIGLAEQLARERTAFMTAARSDDFRGAVEAFLAKRDPAFHGR
jgi:2-(1,2-epoxy-1,2-dihydrophenyl)acetyl-CoA isomerase